jgi:small-conductance mechanosensitive channel
VQTTAGIGYDTPWREVHELLIESARRTTDVQETPKPFILQTALDDYYVEYTLNVYITDADKMMLVYSGLHQNIQDVFNEAGIELLSPHYHAHRDGSYNTTPEPYLPPDYKPPPTFDVKIKQQ